MELRERAQALYEDGDVQAAREAALEGLSEAPSDVELLRLAGAASVELGLDDAVEYLRRAAELEPDDVGVLVDLAYTEWASGRADEALASLERALERDPASAAALRALVDMHRGAGRLEEALARAEELAERYPDDVLATLDVADLSLALDRFDAAVAAFDRLRTIDEEPEHEVYAYHGMIHAALRREDWRRALDLAVEATRVDRYGRTTDALAFAVAQVFGPGERPAPDRAQVEAELEASRGEHRRLHTETLAF